MKAKTKYYIVFCLLVLSFLFLSPFSLTSQTFDGSINLPSGAGKGSMYGDICVAGNFVFLYSADSVTAYSAANGNYLISFAFPGEDNYGKYNPIFYNEMYWMPEANLMAYNSNANILYVVTPGIKIMHISTNGIIPSLLTELYIPHDSIRDQFNPLHGINIITFNADHNKLYWTIGGRNHDENENPIGSFHKRVRYFSIFNVDNEGSLSIIHHEFIKASDNYSDASTSDIEINTDTAQNGNEFFYLSKINRLDVWKISDPTSNPSVSLFHRHDISTTAYDCNFYKFGKMLYINDSTNDIHKLIALPYRFLNHSFSNPHIYILNCNHGDDSTTIVWDSIPSPSKRILDAEYMTEAQHLIVSFAPDTSNTIGQAGLGSDIAVFEYDSASASFSATPIQYINTNMNYPAYDPFDLNASFDLEIIDETDILVCKKDQIVQLHYQGGEYSNDTRKNAENNFFLKSTRTNFAKMFVLNGASNGFDIVETNTSNVSKHNTAYPVYDIVASSLFDKLYFYNKLNVYESPGLYIYNPQNEELISINEDTQPQNDIDVPIGDCIYNPFQDHFLISENASFDDRAACIRVISNDADNTFVANIELIDTSGNNTCYAKKMFIAPNGKLYATTNMRNDPSSLPKVFVFEAKESGSSFYSLIKVIDIGNMIPAVYDGIFEFYAAHFCFNPSDQSVYMTIHPTEKVIDPYNSVPNTIFASFDPFTGNNGALVKISDNSSSITPLNYPGEIICPAALGASPDSRYGSKMYIIGNNFYELEPDSITEFSVSSDTGAFFNDITYSPVDDRIYCLRDDSVTTETHRGIKIFCIDTLNSYNNIFSIEGQATSLFSNPYDNKLYIHQKTDENKLGETPVRLISLDYDPYYQSIQVDSISFEMASIYPEVDHNGDFRFYLFNTIKAIVNPYNNTMYIPNGGHSCVSKFTFTPDESLPLNNETWAWLSTPRMDRVFNNTVHINTVFSNESLVAGEYITGTELQNIPIDYTEPISNVYQITSWDAAADLQDIQSTLGYKLKFVYAQGYEPPDQKWLQLEGNVLDPDYAYVDLAEDPKENWLGYYLYQEQSPFDAISEDDLEHIYSIKGQYWACGKFWEDGIPEPYWVCQCYIGKSVRLKYGDMVVIKTYQPIDDFRWQLFGSPVTDNTDRPETENYNFTQQADYTPIFIELDSTVNPLEIGAFVEDSCVGASSVLPKDTVVLVPAYTEGISGEIYFESYYGTNKSYPAITEYFVANNQLKHFEKRLINTSEQEDYYLVSLKYNDGKSANKSEEDAWIHCHPNPVRSSGTISCNVPADCFVEIKLFDIMGTEQFAISEGRLKAGTHEFLFLGKDVNGKPLSNGTYILSMRSTEYQAQTKIIVIK